MPTGLAKLLNIRPIGKQPAWRSRARLDWKAYFQVFCEQHGEPIVYKNQLLFHDGWRYSMTDYGGPEWPPPEDPRELAQLQLAYFRHKVTIFEQEHRRLTHQLQQLRDLQAAKDVPLQQSRWGRVATDTGDVAWGVDRAPFDFSVITNRLDDLAQWAEDCREHIEELSNGKTT